MATSRASQLDLLAMNDESICSSEGRPVRSSASPDLGGGLSTERGNLTLEFFRVVEALRPEWCLWENVPGVLRNDGGRAFGAVLGQLAQLGYGFAWRVLDSQFFGVPQRRRRVFVVGCSRGRRDRAASVLFEREGVRGHSAAPRLEGNHGRWWNGDDVSQTLDAVLAKGQMLPEKNRFPVVLARRRGSESCSLPSSTSVSAAANLGVSDTPRTLATARVLARLRMTGLSTASDAVCSTHGDLRRLTPTEAERLQGFPAGWTDVQGGSETARYEAIGNSMAVPVMRWIGERIARAELEQ